MQILDRFCVAVVAGAGLCGAASVFSPDAAATPLPTGGATCMEQQAGFGAAPIAAAPVVLPGPVPVAPVVPPVPLAPPLPVAPVVPPVPAAPVIPAAGAAAGADGAPAAAPVNKAAGTGKGAPSGPAAKVSDPVVLPGPPVPLTAEPPPTPIPAVLAGTTTALPACAAVRVPAQ